MPASAGMSGVKLTCRLDIMIDAAIIGLGRWGKGIVQSTQGKSKRLRFIRGVSKEPDEVRDFAATHGFELSTEFADAVADPRVQAVVLATPHSLHVEQIAAVAAAGKPVWCEKPLALTLRRGRARGRGLPEGRRRARARQQQALLSVDAGAAPRCRRRTDRRGAAYRGAFLQRALDARRRPAAGATIRTNRRAAA